jgi:hypothetical protein
MYILTKFVTNHIFLKNRNKINIKKFPSPHRKPDPTRAFPPLLGLIQASLTQRRDTPTRAFPPLLGLIKASLTQRRA